MFTDQELCDPQAVENQLSQSFEELGISEQDRKAVETFLEPLKRKDGDTYLHCVRVGLLTRRIGKHMGLDEKELLMAGLLHDLGKFDTPTGLLNKIDQWTDEDVRVVEDHVMKGYEMIKWKFEITAEIILLHHRFQENRYPKDIPAHFYDFPKETQDYITEYARILALADVYDALHRVNCKFGEKRCLPESEVRDKMIELNPDQGELIGDLYQSGIFPSGRDW